MHLISYLSLGTQTVEAIVRTAGEELQHEHKSETKVAWHVRVRRQKGARRASIDEREWRVEKMEERVERVMRGRSASWRGRWRGMSRRRKGSKGKWMKGKSERG